MIALCCSHQCGESCAVWMACVCSEPRLAGDKQLHDLCAAQSSCFHKRCDPLVGGHAGLIFYK
eukprot:XP_001704907.1 Hypothetical protein GL50803_37288 [Giardia lamblia ATCC 50803]